MTDMAYDHDLADAIRELLESEPGITEKKMFGGIAFLAQGNMAISASGRAEPWSTATPKIHRKSSDPPRQSSRSCAGGPCRTGSEFRPQA